MPTPNLDKFLTTFLGIYLYFFRKLGRWMPPGWMPPGWSPGAIAPFAPPLHANEYVAIYKKPTAVALLTVDLCS